MILKRGVTGFTGGDLSLERDLEASSTEFKKCCYSYVQQINGRVLAWYEPDIDVHYAHAYVEVDEESFYIFYNHMYDYIAFGYFIGERRTCNLYFMDYPSLQSLFEKRYEVLTVYQLEEPLVRQAKDSGKIILNTDDANEIINRDDYCDNYILLNENELNDVELHYVNYFWSHTVGELVFNYWD